jgi:hypothetical protein
MAIKIQNTTVINDSRGLENITNLKTINSESILGTGDISISSGPSNTTIQNKFSSYTVVAGDLGTIINCTAFSFTVSLTAAATLGSGFNCWIWNSSGNSLDVITIDPNGSETIDGLTTLILRQGEGTQIVCDGTNWQTGDVKKYRSYSEKYSSTGTRSIATGIQSVAIAGAQATNTDDIAIGTQAIASGSSSFAVLHGNAAGGGSVAIGKGSSVNGARATGSGAIALGSAYASGTDSFAAAVANNTSSYGATGANSVAIGYQARATSSYGLALGYKASATATGGVAISNSGWSATGAAAEAQGSIAIGNQVTTGSSGFYSINIGTDIQNTQREGINLGKEIKNDTKGKFVWGNGQFDTSGDSQCGSFILRRATTDATSTVLTSNNSASDTTNQVILPNNSAYAFTGIIVARQQAAGGTASAAWKIEGLIRREGSAATTTLVNSALTVIDNTPGWTITLSADTTNGGLAVTATGAASTNIRWVATINTSEVTYA